MIKKLWLSWAMEAAARPKPKELFVNLKHLITLRF